MALPFDLRACAASNDGERGAPSASGPYGPARPRPSRAIVVSSELVDRVRARDVEALRELVRLTYVPLVRFAQTIVRSYDDAEDVVQEVFTNVWDHGARWTPGVDAAAYLFASVRNQALKELRRRERATRREALAHADAVETMPGVRRDPEASALDHVIERETDEAQLRAVQAVLDTCTERQRTAYDLRYHRGLTIPAIAHVLGITVKSAEQLVRRVTHLVVERLQTAGEASR